MAAVSCGHTASSLGDSLPVRGITFLVLNYRNFIQRMHGIHGRSLSS